MVARHKPRSATRSEVTFGLAKHLLLAIVTVAMALTHIRGAHAANPVSPIQHVIVIMQENRSFDTYFGTYPNANGFPAGTCVPIDPTRPQLGCVTPFHDVLDLNAGGPHGRDAEAADIDVGPNGPAMDGFIAQQQYAIRNCGGGAHGAGPMRRV